MDATAENLGKELLPPNLERARQTALVAHSIVIKLKEMGLPDSLERDLAALSTDLADIWGRQAALNEQLEKLVETSGDWRSVGESLVDLKALISHINSHGKNIRKPINKITLFAYKKALAQGVNCEGLDKTARS